MHEYLVTGRAADGATATEIVEAENGDAAVRVFEGRGHTDIVLHTGDTEALWHKPSLMAKFLPPRDIVALRTTGPGRQCALLIRMLYRKGWPLLLLFVVPLAANVAFGWPPGWFVWATLPLAFTPLGVGPWLCFLGSGARYRRLQEAVGWGDWPEVLRLVPRVRAQLPAFELPLRKAQALAGLGRMSEALAEYDQLDASPGLPRPLFWEYRALVYISGHDRANALGAMERAHELMPDNTDVLIDLASLVMVVHRDVPRARALLAAAGRHVLAETAYPFYRACEGLIALAEKRPAEAVASLEDAVRRAEPFLRGNPSVRYHIARLGGHLALAHAANGDHEAARREAARARPVLKANRDATMLAWLADAVG